MSRCIRALRIQWLGILVIDQRKLHPERCAVPTLLGNMLALVNSAGAMEMRNTFIGQVPESRRVTGVGLTMGLSVGLFAYGGLWLDTQFGTKPWLLLACVAAGILGSVLHMIYVLIPEKWPWPKDAVKQSPIAELASKTDKPTEPTENDKTNETKARRNHG